jgi:hypothetical protein
MKPRCAVDAVAIEQCHRRIAKRGGTVDERFGQRGALQKTECGRGMQLDVRHGETSS